jgi:hypothetical protein
MSTVGQLFREEAAPGRPRLAPVEIGNTPIPIAATQYEEQIQAIVHQLFFSRETPVVRNVAFVAAEAETQIAPLCLQVAQALAAESRYDVALIDAGCGEALQVSLRVSPPVRKEPSWSLAPRLWLIPRQSWWSQGAPAPTDREMDQLRQLMSDFDCSVLCSAAGSSLATRAARVCDGIVLVLTANKTRRPVATQLKEQIGRSSIPLLGSVLVERRFPVPEGLYRSL